MARKTKGKALARGFVVFCGLVFAAPLTAQQPPPPQKAAAPAMQPVQKPVAAAVAPRTAGNNNPPAQPQAMNVAATNTPAPAQPMPSAQSQSVQAGAGADAAAPMVQLYMAPSWQPPQELEDSFHLYVGEARIIKLASPVVKSAVGNGKVLSIAAVNSSELLMVANDAGRSTLHLWLKDGTEVSYSAEVGANSPAKTFAQVRELLGNDTDIRSTLVGNRVFLQAETLKPAQVQLIDALQKAFPDQIVLITGGDVALEERTVYINAQLVEIKKSALEKLGVEWEESMDGPGFAVAGDMASNRYIRGVRNENATESMKNLGYVPPFRTALSLASVIGSRINLMRQQGDAYVVAEPRLTARCGGKADFTSGGELPIPIQSGLGQTNVEFKEYGIRLAIEPLCDKLGNIRAKVATEVSQIDTAVAVMGVPGLLTRKAASELDLIEGQAMLLSGLVSYTAGDSENKVPFLGSIPLLGHLFKSTGNHGERSELVVIITPNFITPESETVRKSARRSGQLSRELEEKLLDQNISPLDEKDREKAATPIKATIRTEGAPGVADWAPPNVQSVAIVPGDSHETTAQTGTPKASRPLAYTITGEAVWRPLRVTSDGQKTMIEMPKGIPPERAPVLMVVQGDGEQATPVRYRLEDSRYVVDTVLERAMLVAGAGYYRESVLITRRP